ncbi:dihydroorotate dehydrogenase [Limnoglobus roseus]|uniref:Dihydroorotate dehydrogenase n=1 Tax=Limnoglobus roseus TaxID=2598579 RepID=A0A5C1ASL9_9BACT|nr:dihydroorotate dehydrogenase [Limnoglobus roseus]QEL21036.1 dihydroorotate dehydrogenase [Limnoglobus roseus]
MPDWFYRTVSRPLLYRLPARAARSFALGFMGRLARLPFGGQLIDLLGHMRPDPRLAVTVLGTKFPAAVGLGPGLDVEAVALPALARFGVGFLDVGPIGLAEPPHPLRVERHDASETIAFPNSHPPLGLATARPKLAEAARIGVPVIVRLAARTADELAELVEAVSPQASLIAVPARLLSSAACGRPLLPIVADLQDLQFLERAVGAVVGGAIPRRDGGSEIGATAREPALKLVSTLRERFGPAFAIIARGGVHEAADALALRDTGADLVEVDSGLVFTGPGLVKAVNEAFLARTVTDEPEPAVRPPQRSWFWTLLMGLGMAVGSVLALGIAATRVVLPYDEQFVGMTCGQLRDVNPRLLPFMAHDRVTLAGTMIALGVMYVGLSLGAIRRGHHWAQVAVIDSAGVGFLTFFFFLGYGYLDVLHAFVTGVLFQFLLLAVYADLGPNRPPRHQPTRTDRRWRLGLWGQLILILHAIGVLGAGVVIGGFGMTVVFVPEDLAFMRTTANDLAVANPKLLPLIAHDRATFGGMLICFGIVQLLTCLWGIRARQAWLWWTLFAAGMVGYTPALAVHFAVDYTDLGHLVPAFAGVIAYLVGLGLLGPYMLRPDVGHFVSV